MNAKPEGRTVARRVQKGQLGVPVHGLEHRAESVLRYPSGLHTGPDSTC